jgi:mono/diheme cytochrome c family protein
MTPERTAPPDRIALVPGLASVARGKAVLLASVAVLAGGAIAGCDTQEEADLDRGRDLFAKNCGTCHKLAEARTGGVTGPDLDASFAQARADGMDQDTIEGVVEKQITNPRDVDEGDADYDQLYMPANLVEGQDLQDVAAYVASVAGVEGIEPPPLGDGQEIFLNQCAGCHQLSEANSAGGIGPNLDESISGEDEEWLETAIRDPEEEIAEGFEGGVMPVFDCDAIPQQNLKDLIDYLLDAVPDSKGAAQKLPDECSA